MAAEEPAPPNLLRDLLVFTENKQIPIVVGTDANAHHTRWGSSDINPRGEDLLAYCASANQNFCNVGNKPTFRTKTREEVLGLTLVNRITSILGSRLKAESKNRLKCFVMFVVHAGTSM